MEIVFKRRLTNELLTTYLPSLLLVLMCYATCFFKPIYFEAAVTVNLSILLVTTTLFIRQFKNSHSSICPSIHLSVCLHETGTKQNILQIKVVTYATSKW